MIKKINGKTQHYAWGGKQYLADLLNLPITNQSPPNAEYWLGAHPKASSVLRDHPEKISLHQLIQSDKSLYLGKKVHARFGRLPYLFKVLDVHDMLSIQVHPTKKEAEKGFREENASGIPIDAPHRNYKDDNHKPEIMVALSDFYLLHGFREKESLESQLKNNPELKNFLSLFQEKGYKGLYEKVMTLPQSEVNKMLSPLLNRVLPLYKNKQLSKDQPDYWAAKALDSGMTNLDKIDRGIFSIYFFNLLNLKPGEGIFQKAGMPHAYLEGQNIELMANSDNVLRGGLTKKHVDVQELLKHTTFEGTHPQIIRPDTDQSVTTYPSSVSDFYLERIRLQKGETYSFQSPSLEIVLLLSGEVTLATTEEEIPLQKGEALMVTAGEKAKITAKETSLLFKAGVPAH